MATTSVDRVRRGFVHGPHGDIDYREAGQGTPTGRPRRTPG